jgi:hypothetical protein
MDPQSATQHLDEPVAEDGIRWLNFFNGRVLSAEDLRTEQRAAAVARRQLGRAIGAGIVQGFEVREAPLASSAGAPILTVTPGLAFNESGQALELHRQMSIGLVRPDAPSGGPPGAFARCDVVLPGTAGLGAYLLTVGPATTSAGRAAVAGLGNQPAMCNTAYAVEGVRFRLFPLPLQPGDLAAPELLRNRIAYRLFGVAQAQPLDYGINPYPLVGSARSRTLFDELREVCLGETDVPLATLHWKPLEGIQFVDRWSVRRRPTPLVAGTTHDRLLAARAPADGEARFLQFQEQLEDIRLGPSPPAAVATERFRYLPPAGVLPLTRADTRGFDSLRFFQGLTVRGEIHVEATHVAALLRESLLYAPIDLQSGEAIRLYVVRQNLLADARRFVLFATGHLPYIGDAKFDLAYWDLANYAQRY